MQSWHLPYYARRPRVRLWLPVLAIIAIASAAGLIAHAWTRSATTPIEELNLALEAGNLPRAERLAWKLLDTRPNDVGVWIRFLDAHDALRSTEEMGEEFEEIRAHLVSPFSEQQILQRIARIPGSDSRTLVAFWYRVALLEDDPDPDPVAALADRPQPPRFANFLLGRMAEFDERWAEAARRYEREGLTSGTAGVHHLQHALHLWIENESWPEVESRMRDPRYANAVDAGVRMNVALERRDWLSILLWVWPATFVEIEAWPVILALVSAVLWIFVVTRLGRIHDGVEGRTKLYVLSFLLGIASIYPTLLMIVVEEDVFGFTESAQPLPDLIYFVVGVGLREELAKLLLFLPLLPTLLRRGSRLEAMTCAALVGLGFAAEENVSYFHASDPGTAVARFLTANFLHMSLTALAGLAAFDALRRRNTGSDRFDLVFAVVVLLHGLYDFFLTSEEFAGLSFVSMILLILLTRAFLRQLLIATSERETEGILHMLVWSLAALSGVSYVYASTLTTPLAALGMIALGLFGVAIMIYVFVRELS